MLQIMLKADPLCPQYARTTLQLNVLIEYFSVSECSIRMFP